MSSYNWNCPIARFKPFMHPDMTSTRGANAELRVTFPVRHHLRILRLDVLSNARHVELYDKLGEYASTIKANKIIPPCVDTNMSSQNEPITDGGTKSLSIRWFDCQIIPPSDCNELVIKVRKFYWKNLSGVSSPIFMS